MTGMMTAVRLHFTENLRLDEVPIPDAGPGEVLIRAVPAQRGQQGNRLRAGRAPAGALRAPRRRRAAEPVRHTGGRGSRRPHRRHRARRHDRSCGQYPHLRGLHGGRPPRREGARVRGGADGPEHIAAPVRRVRQGTDHRRVVRRYLRHLGRGRSNCSRVARSTRASSSTRCGRSTKRWTRSAASSATRARSRSTFRHEGTASRLGR